MRRTAFFVLAASFSLSAVGIAFSGDLSQRYAPPAYPPPQPVYDWNRCYGGLNAGGVWSPGIDAFGFTGGGQIGCNWQWYNSFVWGGEADLSILAWMEVVMYSLLALALMKIFAAGGSQHFGDGLDGSSPRV